MKNVQKQLLFIIASITAISIFSAGCGGGSSNLEPAQSFPVIDFRTDTASRTTNKVIENHGNITYSIELMDSSYDSAADSTSFEYRVVSNPDGGPALSHWMLLFPDEYAEEVMLLDSNDKTAEFGYSGATKHTGIKFDKSYKDGEARTVTFSLAGKWMAGNIDIVVKAGNGYVVASAPGPTKGPGQPLELGNIVAITPTTENALNPPSDGWAYVAFLSARDYVILAHSLNFNFEDGHVIDYPASSWVMGNMFNLDEVPQGNGPLAFYIINWGLFLKDSGLGSFFPGYVDGETTFNETTFTITYANEDNVTNLTVTIPSVSIPADFEPRYQGMGNEFVDIQKSVLFYIDEDGNAVEIKNVAHYKELYGLD